MVELKNLAEIRVPTPKADETYEIQLFENTYVFRGLKALLGAADFDKSGDRLSALAAKDDVAREAARKILSQLTLRHLYDRPLTDDSGQIDQIMRVNYDIALDVFRQHANAGPEDPARGRRTVERSDCPWIPVLHGLPLAVGRRTAPLWSCLWSTSSGERSLLEGPALDKERTKLVPIGPAMVRLMPGSEESADRYAGEPPVAGLPLLHGCRPVSSPPHGWLAEMLCCKNCGEEAFAPDPVAPDLVDPDHGTPLRRHPA